MHTTMFVPTLLTLTLFLPTLFNPYNTFTCTLQSLPHPLNPYNVSSDPNEVLIQWWFIML